MQALIKKLLTSPIAYHRVFAEIADSVTAGLMLSQIFYWSQRAKDGWFYKTQEEWHAETCLSRTEQETARKKLRKLGLIEEARRGVPAKVHFKLDESKLYDILQSSMQESCNLDSGKPASRDAEKPRTITETTKDYTENILARPDLSSLAEKVYESWERKDAKKPSIAKTSDAIGKIAKREFIKEAAKAEGIDVQTAASRWLFLQARKQQAIYKAEGRPLDKYPMLSTWMYQERYDDDTLRAVNVRQSTPQAANGLDELRARRAARA